MSGHPYVADCHVHVFDPQRFPYRADADYKPAPHETAPVEQLVAVLDSHRISHALIVTPSAGYGPDNSAAAAAIERFPERFLGIAVTEADVGEPELEELKRRGFAGVRLDLIGRGHDFLAGKGLRLVQCLRELGLVLNVQMECSTLGEQGFEVLRSQAGTTVIDHMGRPDPMLGVTHAGFAALLDLARQDHIFIKLSGPFRFSAERFPYPEADTFAVKILAAFGPERCVWGSDWPFVRMQHRIDYGPAFETLSRWVKNEADRHRILWETPKRLFGFVEPA